MSGTRRGWREDLLALSVLLLLGLGLLSLYGTGYHFFSSLEDPRWVQTSRWERYVARMNGLAFPLLAGIGLALGLCLPQRVASLRFPLLFSLAALSLFGMGTLSGLLRGSGPARAAAGGLTLVLVLALFLVVGLVGAFFLRPGTLTFRIPTRFRQRRLGSLLLHAGILLYALDLVALGGSPYHLAVFWVAALLFLGGSTLAFYSKR
mgnify:CR=1 FL=1